MIDGFFVIVSWNMPTMISFCFNSEFLCEEVFGAGVDYTAYLIKTNTFNPQICGLKFISCSVTRDF